jgi:tRNA(Ile)-lysidine synthase TilS/MesJ
MKTEFSQTLRVLEKNQLEIVKHNLFKNQSSVLIAMSSGQDSISCLFFLFLLNCQWQLNIAIVSCNHFWQRDSFFSSSHSLKVAYLFDQSFSLCLSPFWLFTEKNSRNWRQSLYRRIAFFYSFPFVATGHTASDRAETLVFQLFRGSSLKGILGLHWKRKTNTIFLKNREKSLFFKKCKVFFKFDKRRGIDSAVLTREKRLSYILTINGLKGCFYLIFRRTGNGYGWLWNPRGDLRARVGTPSLALRGLKATRTPEYPLRRCPPWPLGRAIAPSKEGRGGAGGLTLTPLKCIKGFQSLTLLASKANERGTLEFRNKPCIQLRKESEKGKAETRIPLKVKESELFLVRPLLGITRFETNLICKGWNLPIYSDRSNQCIAYARNSIRKQILPLLKTVINPRLEKNISQFGDIMIYENLHFEEITERFANILFLCHAQNIFKRNFLQSKLISCDCNPSRVGRYGALLKPFSPVLNQGSSILPGKPFHIILREKGYGGYSKTICTGLSQGVGLTSPSAEQDSGGGLKPARALTSLEVRRGWVFVALIKETKRISDGENCNSDFRVCTMIPNLLAFLEKKMVFIPFLRTIPISIKRRLLKKTFEELHFKNITFRQIDAFLRKPFCSNPMKYDGGLPGQVPYHSLYSKDKAKPIKLVTKKCENLKSFVSPFNSIYNSIFLDTFVSGLEKNIPKKKRAILFVPSLGSFFCLNQD